MAARKKAARIGRPPGAKSAPRPGTDARLDIEALRSLLAKQGIATAELFRRCILLGYSGSLRSVGMILEGRVDNPSIRVLSPMARVLGVSIDELVVPGDATREPASKSKRSK